MKPVSLSPPSCQRKDAEPRPGKLREYVVTAEQRILEQLDKKPPRGYSTWSGKLVSKALGDVSEHHVWRVLRKHGINLQRRHSWCISTDPQFAQKAADFVGVYLSSPDNAVVICVDEKPAIQVLERAQGYFRLPNGKAITGYNHEYKCHGTTVTWGWATLSNWHYELNGIKASLMRS